MASARAWSPGRRGRGYASPLICKLTATALGQVNLGSKLDFSVVGKRIAESQELFAFGGDLYEMQWRPATQRPYRLSNWNGVKSRQLARNANIGSIRAARAAGKFASSPPAAASTT